MILLEIDTTSMIGVIFGSVLVFTAVPFLFNIYRIKKKENNMKVNPARKNSNTPFSSPSFGMSWYLKHRL